MKKIYFLIPCYNEEENFEQLFRSLLLLKEKLEGYKLHFLLIDDGSTDNTVETFNRSNIPDLELLSLPYNQGPGCAFARGFAHLQGTLEAQDLVFTMEGDNTSRLELIPLMIERMNREGWEVVLASPYSFAGGIQDVTFSRQAISHIANGLTKILLGLHGLQTFSSFFRLYKGSLIIELERTWGRQLIQSHGFESMVEILWKICQQTKSISEYPMLLDWSLRKGKSKMKVWKTSLAYFVLFFKINLYWKKNLRQKMVKKNSILALN